MLCLQLACIYELHQISRAIQVDVAKGGPEGVTIQVSVFQKASFGSHLPASFATANIVEDAIHDGMNRRAGFFYVREK